MAEKTLSTRKVAQDAVIAQSPQAETPAKTRKNAQKHAKKPIADDPDANPVFLRFRDGYDAVKTQMRQQGISFSDVRGGLSWMVGGAFAFYTRQIPTGTFSAYSTNEELHAAYFAWWTAQMEALRTQPESLWLDAERRAALMPIFREMQLLHDAGEIAALNRLFGGVTDQQPVGNHAHYRNWKPVAAPVVSKKAGQELRLTATEATVFNTLTVRFGYRVPMPDGQDGMVCYAAENQGTLKVKPGDRIFAPYNAA